MLAAAGSTLRAKLLWIVGSTAIAFAVLLVTNTIVVGRIDAELAKVEQRLLPRKELGPRLQSELERLSRGFQDAVAAHDADALERTRETEKTFLDLLAAAKDTLDPADAAALRAAMEDWFAAAFDVSRRLLANETGEGIVDAMRGMQTKRARVKELLDRTTSFDRKEITDAFAAAKSAQATARQVQLFVSVGVIGFVLLLAMWLSRGALRALSELALGFARFGKGEFGTPIAVVSSDELGAVAKQANEMAAGLARMKDERDRTDWLKAGHAALSEELRGELTPDEVATRAARSIARHLDVPCAALYVADDAGVLHLRGRYAFSHEGDKPFRVGEGLVGQAATESAITVIEDPPKDYLHVRSGLGEGAPRAIVLVPIVHDKRVSGVLELATFEPWDDHAAELVLSVRETVAIAIEVARARAAMRELLARTEAQALRLQTQEEELRATNEELRTQQEEVLHTNDELMAQARELELQRQILEERNSDLALARRGLERKAQELTTVSAYKSQFLANMSHELRTPLNSMLLLSNLLAENDAKNLTPKQVEYAQTIHGAGNDLLALINQVLDLAKVEAGKQDVHLTDVPLSALGDRCERVFGPLARKKGLRFVVSIDPDLPKSISTDEQRVNQILNNLVGNAIEFTERGEVAIHVCRPKRAPHPDMIAFVVSDTGGGIAPEHQDRIFAPFEQVDGAADRRHGGTGLGLTIARELATLLGGELRLESATGKGSTFTLVLPRTGTPKKAVSEPRTDKTELSLPPSGEDYLLVIEDDRTLADVLASIIRDHGFACVNAPDGATGLRMAKERRPRGIILDVKLPGVDGWSVMEELRSDPTLARIPVHFLSALDEASRGLAMGAIGYATKPATRRQLVDVVETLTKTAPPVARRVLLVEPDDARAAGVLEQLAGDGLAVRRVTSGAAAEKAVSEETFGCAILELALPDIQGVELVRRLAGKVAIVVHTASAIDKTVAKALDAHAATVVLEGPSSDERLLAEIRLFVQRLQEGLAPVRPGAVSADIRLEGRRVLVADDDMRTVYALSATLRAKGVDVVVADTGASAIEALEAHPEVEAILMDVMMPEMDGYEATRRIRKDVRFRSLPIIALTAKAMKGDREKCIEAGATDYLPKPIDADRLLRMLHTLVNPTAPVIDAG